jgi:hypothetical protein
MRSVPRLSDTRRTAFCLHHYLTYRRLGLKSRPVLMLYEFPQSCAWLLKFAHSTSVRSPAYSGVRGLVAQGTVVSRLVLARIDSVSPAALRKAIVPDLQPYNVAIQCNNVNDNHAGNAVVIIALHLRVAFFTVRKWQGIGTRWPRLVNVFITQLQTRGEARSNGGGVWRVWDTTASRILAGRCVRVSCLCLVANTRLGSRPRGWTQLRDGRAGSLSCLRS